MATQPLSTRSEHREVESTMIGEKGRADRTDHDKPDLFSPNYQFHRQRLRVGRFFNTELFRLASPATMRRYGFHSHAERKEKKLRSLEEEGNPDAALSDTTKELKARYQKRLSLFAEMKATFGNYKADSNEEQTGSE